MAVIDEYAKGKWSVRWRERSVTVDEKGVETRGWTARRKTHLTKKAAEAHKRQVEEAASRGENWREEREQPRATLDLVALAYVRAAVDAQAPRATQLFRIAMIRSFLAFAGESTPADALSLSLLERYAASLPGEGRKASTRHRKILEVERMWTWAYERPETLPGVPRPRRLTGRDADSIRPPSPVVAMTAPTWEEVDRMIDHLDQRPWHRRAATVLRYTGLRVAQVLSLDWRDVDLDRGVLRVRAGVRGAKKGRTRVLPIHPALAEEMAAWGVREGLIFHRPDGRAWSPDTLLEPFRRAWRNAGVPADRWDAPDPSEALAGDRAHGRPTHAFRATIRTGLLWERVEEAIVLYLIGHTQGLTAAAYVPEETPEQSPYWPRLVEAIARIPRIGETRNVIPLSGHRSPG